jgi:GDSL-like lipase/acylhydrolase family protein
VTITIGGNDVNFASTVLTCTTSSSTTCRNTVSRNLSQANLASKPDQTYAAIRQHAPNAEVVVLGYPHLHETSLLCNDVFAPSRTNRQILHDGADQLAAIISARAAAAGFTFADVRSRFNGHNICSSSPWVNGSLFSAGANAYHPSATGYLAALDAVTG